MEIVVNPGLPFEMTKIFATLLAVSLFPFAVTDFLNGMPIAWQFWQIAGGTSSVFIVLFAILEYKLNHG